MRVFRVLAIASTAATFGVLGCGEMEGDDVATTQSALTTN